MNPEGIATAAVRVLAGVWMRVWMYRYGRASLGVMLCCVVRVSKVSPPYRQIIPLESADPVKVTVSRPL